MRRWEKARSKTVNKIMGSLEGSYIVDGSGKEYHFRHFKGVLT